MSPLTHPVTGEEVPPNLALVNLAIGEGEDWLEREWARRVKVDARVKALRRWKEAQRGSRSEA